MASTFENLVNNMVNIGIGAAATAAEVGKGVLDDLNAKGEQVRREQASSDFARSMQDIFTQAGGAFSEATEHLSSKGATAAERILDELILARVRNLTISERTAFLAHVRDLVDSVDDTTVTVEVESVESEDEPAADEDAADAPEDAVDASQDEPSGEDA